MSVPTGAQIQAGTAVFIKSSLKILPSGQCVFSAALMFFKFLLKYYIQNPSHEPPGVVCPVSVHSSSQAAFLSLMCPRQHFQHLLQSSGILLPGPYTKIIAFETWAPEPMGFP